MSVQTETLGLATERPVADDPRGVSERAEDTTCILGGTERMDGYDRTAQLARRTEFWLDDLVLNGAMTAEDRGLIHAAYGPGKWTWEPSS